MGRRLFAVPASVAAMLLGLAACAGSRAAPGDNGREPARVRVFNNLIPATYLTISIVTSNGVRYALGNVSGSETKVLRFPQQAPGVQYQLSARTTDRYVLTSRPFSFGEGRVVEWDLRQNTIRGIEESSPFSREQRVPSNE